jgi:hypothetical protein
MGTIKHYFCIAMLWFRVACVVGLAFSIALVALLSALARYGALATHAVLN